MTPTRPGDPRFYALLDEIAALHGGKSLDYAPQHDPLNNFKSSLEFGVRPYLGVLTRLRDKWGRICTFAKSGQLQNESARDSHIDSAVYHLIAALLLEDELPAVDNAQSAGNGVHLPTSESRSTQPPPRLSDGTCCECGAHMSEWHRDNCSCATPRRVYGDAGTYADTSRVYVGEDGNPDLEWQGLNRTQNWNDRTQSGDSTRND